LNDSDDAVAVEQRPLTGKTLKRAVNEIVEALPGYFLKSEIDDEEREDFLKRFANAESLREAVKTIVMVIRTRVPRTINRLLQKLDGDPYDRRWICKKCGYRWGSHDEETLACPNRRDRLSKRERD
jgi:rubrerythrin